MNTKIARAVYNLSLPFLSVLMLASLVFMPLSAAMAGSAEPITIVPDITINEIRIDQPSSDNDEYFELAGTPTTSLDGLTYLVIGDGTGGSGVIEAVVALTGQSIPADGFFLAAEGTFTGTPDLTANLNFENSDNVTHMLVMGFTGLDGNDLDTNDDGVLDLTPWSIEVDRIALIEENNPPSGTEYHYGPPTVGPDGSNVPRHVYLCPVDDWRIGGYTYVTDDTPGVANNCAPPPELDWGDAPDPLYCTLAASTGASHVVLPGAPFLGIMDPTDDPDIEPDGQPDPLALGDDNNGTDPDDEDGVVFTPPMVQGQPAAITFEVNVASAYVDGWIDFNQNGVWGDVAGELVVTGSYPPGVYLTGSTAPPVIIPSNAVPGFTYARFRIYSADPVTPNPCGGPADDGEVEDYQVEIEPDPALGTIIVEKQTDPDLALDDFTFVGDAAGTISDGETIAVYGLTPGVYTSTETIPAGWELTSVVCDDVGSAVASTGNVGVAEATFNLEAGETVTCVFTNTELEPGPSLLINETDADTPGDDELEFIELYDGGIGNTALDGYVVVLYNGSDNLSYTPAFDLDTYTTNAEGYFVIGTVPGADINVSPGSSGWLQNGADAVALFNGDDADFPNDTPVTTENLIDAIVYDTNDGDDSGLLPLLNAGQPQVNENGAGDDDHHSNQRCNNGAGGARNTDTYAQYAPTPGSINTCGAPLINEVDADQSGDDPAEFVELYDGGQGNTDLTGLVLVLFNGSDDASYQAFDLDGQSTNGDGYFVLCGDSANVANCDMDVTPNYHLIQNGADAVALLVGDAADFPEDTAVTTTGLLDAIVYDTDDSDDAGLLVLLNAGQPQVNERDGGDGTAHSNQRCPNGDGGMRNTDTYTQFEPSPGAENYCVATTETTVIVKPEHMNGWGFLEEDPNGTGILEYGPATPPLGNGSAHLYVDATGRELLGTLDFAGSRLDEITELGYSTYVTSTLNGPRAISLQFNIDYDITDTITDTWQGRLVYEPVYDGSQAVAADVWQTWDPLAGNWWASGAPGNTVCTPSTLCTWADVLTNWPDAGLFVEPTWGGLMFKAGGPWAPEFDGWVDALNIKVATDKYIYDFEPSYSEFCGDPATFIHIIQGEGLTSTLQSEIHIIEGIVVGDFQGSDGLSGFFVQEEDADFDADPLTSEGIFVMDGDAPALDVNVGDLVRVKGVVEEDYSFTRLKDVNDNVGICATGAIATPASVELPVAAINDWEPTEGMLLNIPQTLYATDNYNLGRYGEVMLSVSDRLYNPTNVVLPGAPANELQDINNRSQIQLDDGSNVSNPSPVPYLGLDDTLRAGDSIPSFTGVLGYAYGVYELHPTDDVNFVRDNPRPTGPPDVGGRLTVASFNVLNYFVTLDNSGAICGPTGGMDCRGADNAAEFTRQRDKIIDAITKMDADVIGLMEIENHPTDNAVADLVSGLNAVAGPGTYASINTGPIGTDAIKVALIYKPATVSPASSFAILDSGVDPTFNDTKNRPVLAQTFMENSTGEKFTVAVNHLKSKGSDCNDIGDPDTGDGQGNCNLTRTAAANALVDWLAYAPTFTGELSYLIIGDLNSYAMEDPITAIKDAGYTNLVELYDGADAYSYVYFGQAGYLDHALGSPNMTARVTGAGVWHINADEPSALNYNDYNQPELYNPDKFRSSDHDAVLVGIGSVYEHDFETPVGDEWCYDWQDTTPAAGDTFMGQFGNHQVCLNLTDLNPHNWVNVSFDLYIIRSWNGNLTTMTIPDPWSFGPEVTDDFNPDRWSLSANGVSVLDTTFANMPMDQSYPGNYLINYPYRTGAVGVNTLGYFYKLVPMDTVYHLNYFVHHSSDLLELLFEGFGLDIIDNESWGVDNVKIDLIFEIHNIYLPIVVR